MRGHIAVALAIVGLLGVGQVQAAERNWVGGTGNWNDPNLWDPNDSAPVTGDYATINNGGDGVTVTDTQSAYNVYVGATRYEDSEYYATNPQTNYNTLTVSGGGANLTTEGNIFLSANLTNPSYLYASDYNQLIVENGATVNAKNIVSALSLGTATDPNNGGYHNKLLIQSGGVVNCASGYQVNMRGGDLIIDGGTLNVPDGNVYISYFNVPTSGQATGQYMLLLKKGLIDTTSLSMGAGVVRIGDGYGDSGEARINIVNGMISRDSLVDVQTPIDPNSPSGPYFSADTTIAVMSDGIISANWCSLVANSVNQDPNSTILIMSGGQIDPGEIDNSAAGEVWLTAGTLKFASGGILDIDLFGEDDNDKLVWDDIYSGQTALNIDPNAILNVRLQPGCTPDPNTTWEVLTWEPGSITGTFTINNDAGYQFTMDYNDITGVGTLTFVPEPATLTLLALGGAGLTLRRRRRPLR